MYSQDSAASAAAERLARNKGGVNEGLNFPSVKSVRNKILWFISKPEMDKVGFGGGKKIGKLVSRTLDSDIYIFVVVGGFVSVCLQSFRTDP